MVKHDLKWGALSFKLYWKRLVYGSHLTCKCILDDALLFQNKENKILFGPPPPQKKAQGYERSRYVYTHKGFSIQSARDLEIHWVENEQFEWFRLQSNPFIENYYLIIVVFSCPHFSIYDIFYTLENIRSFNKRVT